ncbi:MAG: TetR/AcrR family transcriptional regulator [Bifidobacteriaceae bacterium]|nr:TetR/AcrR family transcriptional regulator [Bifidobacteriaceae bacterium]MCI1979313.1 TetR/AcrR family transcriptional regulator [Bifidobacteriaceae bacterium]
MVNSLDPRVKRTRRLIQRSFWDLMKKNGYEAVTVSDVTNKAGINRATFYAHYSDKADVLSDLAATAFLGLVPASLKGAAVFNEDTCAAFVELTNAYVESFYEVCRFDDKSYALQIDGKMRKCFFELVQTVMVKDPDIPTAGLSAVLVSSAIYGAAFHAYLENDQIDEKLPQKITPFVMRGLGRDESNPRKRLS